MPYRSPNSAIQPRFPMHVTTVASDMYKIIGDAEKYLLISLHFFVSLYQFNFHNLISRIRIIFIFKISNICLRTFLIFILNCPYDQYSKLWSCTVIFFYLLILHFLYLTEAIIESKPFPSTHISFCLSSFSLHNSLCLCVSFCLPILLFWLMLVELRFNQKQEVFQYGTWKLESHHKDALLSALSNSGKVKRTGFKSNFDKMRWSRSARVIAR